MSTKHKVNGATEVMVDPQELTEFLRSSRVTIENPDTAALKTEEEEEEPSFSNGSARKHDTPSGIGIAAKPKPKTGWKRFAGIVLALTGGLCFTVANLLVKSLKNHHPVNLSFWRYTGFFIPTVPYIVYMKIFKNVNLLDSITGPNKEPTQCCGCCKISAKSNNVIKMLGTSAIGIIIFILRFASLNYLTIADSTVIVFSGPLFTIVFGHFFLKEKCGFSTIPISCFTLLGVIVIARPPFLTGGELDNLVLIGIALAFTSTILGAVYFMGLRILRHVHFMVMTCSAGTTGLLLAGSVTWALGVFQLPRGTTEILVVLALSLLSFMGGACINFALKFEEAGTVSVIRMVDVLYSFFFEFAWFGVIPDIYSIVGAIIVMSGVSLITFRKIISTLPETHCLRRTFGFLLL